MSATPQRAAAPRARSTVGGRCAGYALAGTVLSAAVLADAWLAVAAAATAGVLVAARILRPRAGGLVVEVTGPVRTTVGQEVEHVVHVRNDGARATSPARLVHRAAGFGDAPVAVPALAPGASVAVTVRRTAVHRAASRTGVAEIVATDPFGVLAVHALVPTAQHLLVHPAPRPAAALPPPSSCGAAGGPGAAGGEPDGVRPWRTGDRRRDLHWRSTARRGVPVALDRSGGAPCRLVAVLDGAPDPCGRQPDGWEDLLAAHAAALAAQLRTGRQVAVVARLAGGALAATDLTGEGARGPRELLDLLAGLGPVLRADEDVLARAARWAGCGHVVLVRAGGCGPRRPGWAA
ncbi:hypothetical protein NUM3379_01390 [Kineococcus sp. NUM-3379]